MTADHRSAHPNFPGVPWWGALLFAVTLTAVGFAFDAGSGDKELSMVFAACYALGCVAAVLAVRQSSIFTAVIQPPLILFVAVPTAYFLFHGAHITGVKDTLINFGYPLIERFPLMFFTSAAVLIIGMLRWYFGMWTRRAVPSDDAAGNGNGLVSSVTSKVSSLLGGNDESDADDDADDARRTRRRRHSIDRPVRPNRAVADETPRSGRPRRVAAPRSRHARPPETEIIEPVVERPRRPRRQTEPPPTPAGEPRRRPRTSSPREPRGSSAREPRKGSPPSDRRTPYERPERRRRYDDYEPMEPHTSNGNGTHHPISRVRYRGEGDSDNRAEYRTRRRTSRDAEAEGWEYDI